MSNYKFKIEKHIGVIGENPYGWTKELNLVSWNDRPAKYDIREWSSNHEKMSKGITLDNNEIMNLKLLLNESEVL